MNSRMQDSKGKIILKRKGSCLVICEKDAIEPNEDTMFGDLRCHNEPP